MIKRVYADRPNWKRLIQSSYDQIHLQSESFSGYVTLITMHEVASPLKVNYGEESMCIADDGYMWMQHFPAGQAYTMTTMFDQKGIVIQHYLDICIQHGVENGVPWLDDLFLDIVLLPSGKKYLLDAHELDEAFQNGDINQQLFEQAWTQAKYLNNMIEKREFNLPQLANDHLHLLKKRCKNRNEVL